MSPFQVSNFLKALLLGFFCCLGAVSAADDEEKKAAKPVALFSLNEVHADSDALIPEIQAGMQLPPPGYWVCEFPILDGNGKRTGARSLLLSRRAIVAAADVQVAIATGNSGEIAVRLTPEGGKRVSNTTDKMRLGRDRIAVVIEGKGVIAPTVQARLGREFMINGLDSKEETQRIVQAFKKAVKAPK
ncbi:hypothetical protein V2O64_02845 [Verrucomicrobiaceae bacterium 227]